MSSQGASSKSWGIWSSGKQQAGTASPLGQQEAWARSSASTPNTGTAQAHTNSIGPPSATNNNNNGTGSSGSGMQGLAITSGAMETFGELLSRSPQNGRRASPELPRTSSPFLHMRESRQRQATAAQAAALGPARASPGEHFGNATAAATEGSSGSAAIGYDDESTGPTSSTSTQQQGHGRMKSVMQARLDNTEAFLQGPARSTSTPPYAIQPSSTERFSGMPFFTPQVMQRGQFDAPSQTTREAELMGAMRSHTIQESAPGKSTSRSASPYISQSANATPFMPQGQQQQHAGFGGSNALYGEYDAYGRGFEDPYRMVPPNGYAMYGADPYGYTAYDTRSMPRGGFRPDEFRGHAYGGSVGRAGGQSRYPQNNNNRGGEYYGYPGGEAYYDPRATLGMPAPMAHGHPGSRHTSGRREDPAAGMRSQVLEEFRNNKAKKVDLTDIFGHVVEFSGDQHGSRFIQQKLETASSDDKEALFQEIVPNCLQLMTDVFGNYVIQKFFEHGNQVQKTVLAKHMETHVLSLSLQMYGCRVVQKALEHVLAEQQASMVKELDGHVLKCVKDQNGNHVIQKALERVPADKIDFILNAFAGQAYILATHPYGCRVIQRVLEHCPTAQASILEELHRYTQNLVVDQYGNYVSQHLIERGSNEDKSRVIGVIKGQVLTLSKHKFASNVVEKCIMFGDADERHMLIEEVLALNPDGSSNLSALMKDQYGNYVLQKMLEVSDGAQRHELANKIRPLLESLKKFSYGKHLSSIERLLERASLDNSASVSPAHSISGDKRADARASA